MNLSSRGPKNPVCKFSWSYDDRYYIDFMVRTDPRITDTQTDRHTDPQTTSRVSGETYRTRGETIGFKKEKSFGSYLDRAILVSCVLVMSDGSMQLQSEWRYVIVAIFTFMLGVCVESTRKRVTKFH